MQVVILAGGMGTRLSEETDIRPKPLVEIGGRPIIWHVMKIYEAAGFNDFIICCGFKGYMLKDYFCSYFMHVCDLVVDLADNRIEYINKGRERWRVTLVDTGLETMTGGRIKRIRPHLKDDRSFCLTYGDGVADIDVKQVVDFHQSHGGEVTVTAVPSPGRFGILDIGAKRNVRQFLEKPQNEVGWINGGFFVVNTSAIDVIQGDSTSWEREPLEQLARDGHLMAYQHEGFWRPMDTLRDKRELEELWASGRAPWKIW
jgi:glucose-1-phosphate cytidylyltransferase